MTMEIGVLFADLRGFTSESELQSPLEVSAKLRRFYAHAEKVLLPEALIDRLIGDEDLDARKLAATQGLVASAHEMPSMVAAVSTP
jgi:hypothetical protein